MDKLLNFCENVAEKSANSQWTNDVTYIRHRSWAGYPSPPALSTGANGQAQAPKLKRRERSKCLMLQLLLPLLLLLLGQRGYVASCSFVVVVVTCMYL